MKLTLVRKGWDFQCTALIILFLLLLIVPSFRPSRVATNDLILSISASGNLILFYAINYKD